jgi:small subunit ribosomal protein S20
MANTKSSAKRARQTPKRTLVNRRSTSAVKNLLKNVREVLATGKKEESKAAAQAYISKLDKAVKCGRIHKNSANRHKSVIGKALAALK